MKFLKWLKALFEPRPIVVHVHVQGYKVESEKLSDTIIKIFQEQQRRGRLIP